MIFLVMTIRRRLRRLEGAVDSLGDGEGVRRRLVDGVTAEVDPHPLLVVQPFDRLVWVDGEELELAYEVVVS